jgi:hypothetical protein
MITEIDSPKVKAILDWVDSLEELNDLGDIGSTPDTEEARAELKEVLDAAYWGWLNA